jgi:flagellin FlaB
MKRDNAFTGLEAAIVLIAFVVVATVFSYVMISAGFYASQRAQEVTYAGIKQVTSIMYPTGSVHGVIADDGSLNFVEFGLGIPDIGQPQDLVNLHLLLSQSNSIPVSIGNTQAPINSTKPQTGVDCWIFKTDGDWTYIENGVPTLVPDQAGGVVSSSIVRSKDSIRIRILLGNTGGPKSEQSFTLEIMPQYGPSVLISKTIPQGYNGGRIR